MRTKYVNGQLCFLQEDGDPIMIVPDAALPFLGSVKEREVHPLLLFAMMASLAEGEVEVC